MAASRPTATLEIDCRGLLCPLPVLRTRQAILRLAPGEVLKMVATDPGSVPDMAAFSRATGHEIVEQGESDGEYTFYFRRAERGSRESTT